MSTIDKLQRIVDRTIVSEIQLRHLLARTIPKDHLCPDCLRPCTCCIEAVEEPNYCTHDCEEEARRRAENYWENQIDEAIEERIEREGK